ncbi:MAG TPA: hypothetical protein VFL17_17185 [Anaerolineae bacterium]|nr:hypothetical protein [Anaerolineae bacterium]
MSIDELDFERYENSFPLWLGTATGNEQGQYHQACDQAFCQTSSVV